MTRAQARTRAAAAGAGGAVLWLLTTAAVAPIVGGTTAVGIAEAAVDASPGALATAAIDLLGKAALPLAVAGIVAAVVAAGALAGAAWERVGGTHARRAGAAALLLAVTGLAVATAGPAPLRWLAGTALAGGPVLLYALLVGRALPAAGSTDRRTVLQGLGAALLGVVGVGALARGVARRAGGDEGEGQPLDEVAEKREGGRTIGAGATARTVATPDVTDQRSVGTVTVSTAPDGEFGFDFAGMPRPVTPVGAHYVIDKNVTPPAIDRESWSLSVDGAAAGDPYALGFGDLLDLEGVERPVTMVCISNEVGGELVSTGRWVGVPLRELVERAGPDGVRDVVTNAADGYHEAIPWEYVREHPEVMVAYGLNGRTLTAAHGYPARLLIPGRYGMRSTKWLTGIDLVPAEHDAYWEERGWNERAVVNTLSYVRAVQRRGDRVAVGGMAYAGLRGIDRVEVSLDGGDTWREATLEEPVAELTRHRWRAVAAVPDGEFEVVTRATDGTGQRQTRIPSPPHPDGATGWHRATVGF